MKNRVHVPVVQARTWFAVGKKAEKLIDEQYPRLQRIPGPFPIEKFIEFRLRKTFGFEYAVKGLPDGLEAMTVLRKKIMIFSEETWEGLRAGTPRARFTAAHEVGHVSLHVKDLGPQILENRGVLTLKRGNIPPYRDPECQANAFAAALLMPTYHMEKLLKERKGPQEVCEIFNVSLEAACYRIGNIEKYLK